MPTFWKRIFVLLLAGLMLSGCGGYDQETWSQKVIVEVETPQGLVTGSSVQQVVYSKANFQVPAGGSSSYRATGEAVVVDLGSAGTLFALLKGEQHMGDAGKLALTAFFGTDPQNWPNSTGPIETLINLPYGSIGELPTENYPLLVTFTDINDPATIKRVDPNDLEASFGPGVRLKRITVTMTDESETEGRVSKTLEWIGDLKTLDRIWGGLSPDTRDLLINGNWKKP